MTEPNPAARDEPGVSCRSTSLTRRGSNIESKKQPSMYSMPSLVARRVTKEVDLYTEIEACEKEIQTETTPKNYTLRDMRCCDAKGLD